jgi:hypothetical protein
VQAFQGPEMVKNVDLDIFAKSLKSTPLLQIFNSKGGGGSPLAPNYPCLNLVLTQLVFLDPSPWLIVSPELKDKLKSKPYDPKKSCWVPNKATHGYDEGLIEKTDGEKVTVKLIESKEVE